MSTLARATALRAEADALEAQARAKRSEADALEQDSADPERRDLVLVVDRNGLAKALGCSLATVDRLRLAGAPTLWVCGAPRFEIPDVLAWLRQQPAGMKAS